MPEYIERNYIRKMAMLEMAYTMETETDAAVVLRMIDDAPAADVAPVVRCKDCQNCQGMHGVSGILLCMNHLGTVLPDDFCSYGKRKDAPCTTP